METPPTVARFGPIWPGSLLARGRESGSAASLRDIRGTGIGGVGGCSGVIRSGKTFSLVPFCSISFHSWS